MTADQQPTPPGADPRLSETVRTVTLDMCDLCMSGAGGECHTPGCGFFLNRAPDLPLTPTIEAVGIVRVDTHDEALKDEVYNWIADGYHVDDADLRYSIGLVFRALAALRGEQ